MCSLWTALRLGPLCKVVVLASFWRGELGELFGDFAAFELFWLPLRGKQKLHGVKGHGVGGVNTIARDWWGSPPSLNEPLGNWLVWLH